VRTTRANELPQKDVATLQWWTVRELAVRWKVSQDVVYDLLTSKELLGRKIGGNWRVHSDAVHAYEASGIPKQRRESAKFRTVPDALGRRAKSST
jgi:excisionase family DNA binding protein